MTTIKQYKAMIDGASDGLLPCPFCGSKDIGGIAFTASPAEIHCYGCDAIITGNGIIDATKKWNTRADKLTPELIRVMELMGEALDACQIRLANNQVLEPVELDIALSEYRKLKGE